MKRLILFWALWSFVFTSCEYVSNIEEDSGNTPSIPQIELTQQTIEVDFESNEYAIPITSPYSWEAKSKNDWLILKTESGIGGTKDLKFYVERNVEEVIREGTIVIQNEDRDLYVELYVSQKPFEPILEFDSTEVSVDMDGGSVDIMVVANAEYEISCEEEWITYSYFANEQGDTGIRIYVSQSMIAEERVADVLVSLPRYNVSKTIKVVQMAFVPYLEIDVTELMFDAEGGYKYVDVTTNAPFSIYEDADWITTSKSGNSVRITVSASTITEECSADVTIYLQNYDISKVIKVTQSAFVPSLSTDVDEISFNAEGGSQYVYITTNATYSVSVDADWLTYNDYGDCVRFTASSSTIAENRSADVTIYLPNYDISKIITVNQRAFEPIFSVPDTSDIEFDYNGGDSVVLVTSNFDYQIECVSEWVTYQKIVDGIKLTVAPNYVMEPRLTTISISGAKYNFGNVEITITQSIMPSDYTVIEYTTDFGGIVTPYDTDAFGGAKIVSNTYENGKGILKFDTPITTIGDNAFKNSLITSICIPDNVTTIGSYAFYDCNGLTQIIIPDSVTKIRDNAFYSCNGLTSITIPSGVTRIGSNAFYYCENLISIYITDLSTWCKIDFYNQYANPLYYANNLYLNNELLTKLVIPSDVTKIGDFAFKSCSNLTSVTIPNSVTKIGNETFQSCSKLQFIYCQPSNPPQIYPGTFPSNREMKIYVPRNSYNSYMQYDSIVYGASQENWSNYDTYVELYDFE